MTKHYTFTKDAEHSVKVGIISELRAAIENGMLEQFEATISTGGLEGKFTHCAVSISGYIKVSQTGDCGLDAWAIADDHNNPMLVLKNISFDVQTPTPTPTIMGLERIEEARATFDTGYYDDKVGIGAIDYACVIPVVTKSEVIAMTSTIDGYVLIWFDKRGEVHYAYGNQADVIIDRYGYAVGYLLPRADARNVSYPRIDQ